MCIVCRCRYFTIIGYSTITCVIYLPHGLRVNLFGSDYEHSCLIRQAKVLLSFFSKRRNLSSSLEFGGWCVTNLVPLISAFSSSSRLSLEIRDNHYQGGKCSDVEPKCLQTFSSLSLPRKEIGAYFRSGNHLFACYAMTLKQIFNDT